MGLTFLAAGMSVPEAVSSVIVANQGTVNAEDSEKKWIAASNCDVARVSHEFPFYVCELSSINHCNFPGYGAMGISNSIGSNVFDVLLCLGLPWFVKAALLPSVSGQYYVQINSQGLVYSSVSLFSTLIILYGALFINKFTLSRTVGIVCLVMYVVFLIFASVVELNTFFIVNLPICID